MVTYFIEQNKTRRSPNAFSRLLLFMLNACKHVSNGTPVSLTLREKNIE